LDDAQSYLQLHSDVVQRLEEIKRDTAAPEEVPLLRILDITIWMRQHGKAFVHREDEGLRHLDPIPV